MKATVLLSMTEQMNTNNNFDACDKYLRGEREADRMGDLDTLRAGDPFPLRAGLTDLEADLEADLHARTLLVQSALYWLLQIFFLINVSLTSRASCESVISHSLDISSSS